jgi:hypothetical protein
MELNTTSQYYSTAAAGGYLVSTEDDHYQGAAISAVISESAVRNIYIAIGTVGFVGNLFVIIIITCYTSMTDKVS